MGRLTTIGRRAFLIGSVAVGGGVAFGTFLSKQDADNPLLADAGEGEAIFNPWIRIDSDKITLITPHSDKGQGVVSVQAALLAEELDVEFGQFETDFGKPSAAYWNTALGLEGAPFMATDRSIAAESARTVIGGIVKIAGLQITGGSSTVPDSFDKLRRAGAVARETLKKAASIKSGIAVEQLKTANGAVQLPDGSELKYTELADIASGLDPVHVTELRPETEWRLLGKEMQRLDIIGKSTGTLPYGIDVSVDGMVHAAIKVNPRQGAPLTSYDASAAKKMRGVKQIVEITNGIAVIADNSWRAFQALEEVEYDWAEAPYPAEQEDHWKAVEASFTEERLDSVWRNEGDAEASTAEGDIFEAEYRSPYVAHAPLEPLNAIVRVTDEGVEVWTGHQIQRQIQVLVSQITGHSPEQVVLHNQFIGGSFGHRLEFEHIKQAAEIANQLRGTPVKLVYRREEDFAHDFPRHISIGRGRGKVEDGKVVTMDFQVAAPSVVASQMSRAQLPGGGPDSQIPAGAWNNPYKMENFRLRAYRVPELAPVSSWRAVGSPGSGFHFDCFLDELIHEAGADPVAERIRLMSDPVSRTVLETVAEMSSWGGELATGKGRGIAFVESFGVPVAEVVEVSDTSDGIKIDKVWVACDVGKVLDPVNFENLVQGGVIFGLGHAMNCEITYSDGMAEQENYYDHEGMRISQCPEIIVKGLENQDQIRGIGEPPVPPAAPALANAIFAATGKRIRELPMNRHIDFA